VNQHAARAEGGVIDGVARTWLQNTNERVDDLGRGEELSGLGAGVVRELLDEELVGAAEDSRRPKGGLRVAGALASLCVDRCSFDCNEHGHESFLAGDAVFNID
jgi:hypothetical protein